MSEATNDTDEQRRARRATAGTARCTLGLPHDGPCIWGPLGGRFPGVAEEVDPRVASFATGTAQPPVTVTIGDRVISRDRATGAVTVSRVGDLDPNGLRGERGEEAAVLAPQMDQGNESLGRDLSHGAPGNLAQQRVGAEKGREVPTPALAERAVPERALGGDPLGERLSEIGHEMPPVGPAASSGKSGGRADSHLPPPTDSRPKLTERQRGALGVVSRRELEEAGLREPKRAPPGCVACGAEDLKPLSWSIGIKEPPLTRFLPLCETCNWYVRAEVIAEHEARDVEVVRAELVQADEVKLAGTRCRACGGPASSAWQHAANPERSIALCATCARSLESGAVAREFGGGA